MKIGIIGLGLIGASYAEGLKVSGYEIHGYDIDKEVTKSALKDNVIDKEINLEKKFAKFDLLILSLYPKDNIKFIKEYKHLINKNTVISDVAGSKTKMLHEIATIVKGDFIYVSHHPMAGREVSGYQNRDYTIFKKANFIIIKGDKRGTTLLEKVAHDLKFKNILTVSMEEHDELIAHTSQLTHILAVGLVNLNTSELIKKATGDSYRDLTRIANINEVMWTELFIDNKETLVKTIDQFKLELEKVKKLIENENIQELYDYLIKARERRVFLEKD